MKSQNRGPLPPAPKRRPAILASSIAALAVLCLLPRPALAQSATWLSNPSTGDWNTAANWNPAMVPNSSTATATFGASNTVSLSLSANTEVGAITFTSPYAITTGNAFVFTISGFGIDNNSSNTTFFTVEPGGTIDFENSATGSAGTRNTGSTQSFGRLVQFTTLGATGSNGPAGIINFSDSSTAGSANITNLSGTTSNASGGSTNFSGHATAGTANITNAGATVPTAIGGSTTFTDNATAGNATITTGGTTTFSGSATAGAATLLTDGGTISFSESADGGHANATTNAGATFDLSGLTDGGMKIGSISGAGTYNLGGNTFTVGGNGLSTTVSGVIGGSGSLVVTGPGSLTLTGQNTYTGSTSIINGGVLNANVAGALSAPVADGGNGTTRTSLFMDTTGTGGSTLNLGANQAVASLAGPASSSTINLNGNTLTVGNTAGILSIFAGVIADGTGNPGSGGLTTDGTGTLTLAGNNTYTGQTTVNGANTLQVGNGTTGNLTGTSGVVVNGGELETNLGNGAVFSKNVALNGTSFFVGGASGTNINTISGIISGGGEFDQDGTGTTFLTGAQTYSGATSVNAGTLQLGAGGKAGSIANTSNINVSPNGTLVVANTGGVFANTVNVQGSTGLTGGTIIFSLNSTAGTANITNGGGTTDNASGGSIDFGNNSTAGSATISNAGGAGNMAFGGFLDFSDNTTAGSAQITNNGGTTSSAFGASTSFFVNATAGNATITNNGGTVSGALGSVTTFEATSSAGTVTLTANGATVNGAGAGTIIFTDSSFAGQATLNVTGGSNGGAGGTITFQGHADGGTANVNNSGGTFDISGLTNAGMNIGSINGAGIFALGSKNLTVVASITGRFVSGVIEDGGQAGGTGGSLTVSTGGLTLLGQNTYTGTTSIINGGTLDAYAAGALPAPAADGGTGTIRDALSMDQTGTGGSTLNLGANQAVASLSGAASSKIFLTFRTLTVGNTNNLNSTFAGVIADGSANLGGGNLTVDGNGTLILTGNNTYTGQTTVNGFLQVGDGTTGNLIGTSGVLVGNSSVLETNLGSGSVFSSNVNLNTSTAALHAIEAGTNTLSGIISGTGFFSQDGSGTTILTRANSYTGLTVINAGTLQIGTANSSGWIVNAVTVRDGGTLSLVNVAGTGGTFSGAFANNVSNDAGGVGTVNVNPTTGLTMILSGALTDGSGQLALTKNGPGTAIISGNSNTYTGATTVNGGVLEVDGSLGATTVTVNKSATLTGGGTIGGSVNILSGGSLQPTAGSSSILGNLVLNTGANTNIMLGAPGGVQEAVSGSITIGGNLNVTPLAGFGAGTYPLFDYGTLTNKSFTISALPGYTTKITTTGGVVDLVVALAAGTLAEQNWNAIGNGTSNGGDGTWNTTATNWSNPSNSTTTTHWLGGTADFGVTGGTVTIPAATTIGAQGLIFDANGYNINGANATTSALNLTGKATITVNTGDATINAKITSSAGLIVNGAGALFLANSANAVSGKVLVTAGTLQIGTNAAAGSLGAGATVTLNNGILQIVSILNNTLPNAISGAGQGGELDIVSVNPLTISGALSDSATGQLALGVGGSAATILTNPGNTFSGGTSIGNTTLQIGTSTVAGSIGAGSPVYDDGKLSLVNVAGNVFANNVSGPINSMGTVDVSSTANLKLSGVLTDGPDTGKLQLFKSGSGTATLTGNNSYSYTEVDAGTLQLGDGTTAQMSISSLGNPVQVKGTATLATNFRPGATYADAVTLNTATSVFNAIQTGTNTLSGVISGSGSFNQKGPGTTILTATETYTGATTVTAGLLQVGNGTSGNLTALVGVTVSGTGNLALDQADGSSFDTTIKLSTAANHLHTIQLGSTEITGIISGLGVFDQDGPGDTALTADETYTGGTNVDAGTLKVNASLAAGPVKVNGGTLVVAGTLPAGATSTVTVNTSGTLTGNGSIGGNVTLAGGTIDFSNPDAIILGTLGITGGAWTGTGTVAKAVTSNSGAFHLGGTLTAPLGLAVTGGMIAGNGQLIGSLNYTSTASSTFAGVIADGAAKSTLTINKAASTLTLTGTNTYTGATTVSAGTLQIGDGNNGRLAAASAVTVSGSGKLSVNQPDNAIFSNAVALTASTATFEASGAGVSVDLTGVISGTGSFEEDGPGSSILDANETYTGKTLVNSGTLIVDGSLAAGSAVTVASVGTLHGTGTINGNVTSNGTLDLNGAIGGTLTLTGGSWTGTGKVAKAVTVSSGAFNLGGTLTAPLGLAVSGAGTIAGTGQLIGSLNYTSSASSTFTGVIADGTAKSTLTMNKAASTLTLTGTNTYTGATTVTAGTLRVNGSLATTAVVVNNGGILAGSGTLNGVETINSGGILAPSSGGFIPTTLTVGSLTLNSGAKVNYQLGAAGATGAGVNDLTVVNGSLNLGTGATLNITPLFGFGVGTYELFSATSLPSGTLKIGTVPTGYVAADFSISIQSATDEVLLTVIASPPSNVQYWNGAITSANNTINGGSGTWDNTTTNWTNSTGATSVKWAGAGSAAIFSTGSGTVTVGGNVTAPSLGFISGAGAYTIKVGTTNTLTISGAGITNTSGLTQNLETATDASGHVGTIKFTGSATAGNITITNDGGSVYSSSGGATIFSNTSTAATATINNQGGTATGAPGGITTFLAGNAGSATINDQGGTNGGQGGATFFVGAVNGGTAQVINTGNGDFDISGLTAAGTIGSISGSGTFALGKWALTVGGNNQSTTVTGAITDGGSLGGTGGSLVKTGTGTLTLTGASTYSGATTVNAGTLQIGDGNTGTTALTSSGVTVASGATLAMDLKDGKSFATKVTDNGHFVDLGTSAHYTISSVISGSGDFTQTGAVTTTLTGANTYTGGTKVNAGTLVANNATSATGSGPVIVNDGGTLGGAGKITGATTLNNGGQIAPAAGSPSVLGTTLHATSLLWNPGGTLTLQLGVDGDDKLILTGALTKGTTGTGIYSVEIADIGGIALGDYTLATFASTTFAATDFNLELPGNYHGSLSITGGKNLVLDLIAGSNEQPAHSEALDLLASDNAPTPSTDSGSSFGLTPTPEPTSAALLAFGGVALLGYRRRR